MLKQSLEAQIAADEKDMKEEKASKAESLEGKAEATGDLEVATKELANAEATLATARAACMKVGADHEMTAHTRVRTEADLAQAEVVTLVKRLAHQHHSAA